MTKHAKVPKMTRGQLWDVRHERHRMRKIRQIIRAESRRSRS